MGGVISIDDVKEYLNKVRHIDKEIDAKEEIKTQMGRRLTTVSATSYREIDVQGGVKKTSEDRIIEYIEHSEHINEMIDELINLKMKVVDEIERINDGLYRTLLTERYINNKNWEEVAGILGYDSRHTLRLHNDALRAFSKSNNSCHQMSLYDS